MEITKIKDDDLIAHIEDWKFEERLSKEFEAVGFFISDHPLNQYKDTFVDYNIIDYQAFTNNNSIEKSNIAATLLKIQERKTAKGNSYAVLKLTDLTSVFELFIFSDVLELNREILKEGNSLILTLIKSISNEENRFKRTNVQKIASLKNLIDSPINEVTFNVNSMKKFNDLSKFLNDNGDTTININMKENGKTLNFKLKNPRKLDRKTINLIRNREISTIIS